MKAVVLASGLLLLPVSAAMARGDGFGAAFGGSVVGSTLGTIIGNSVSRPPPPPPVYYQPAPVYVVPRYVPAPVVHHVPVYAAALPPDPESVSYQQGSADRDQWDGWYDRLDGKTKQGAQFWADERGRPAPQQCRVHASFGNDWMDGCTSAQRRLAAPDDRRRTDAQYRNGWDKLLPEVRPAAAAPPAPPPAPVLPTPTPISAPVAPAAPPPEAKEAGLGDVFNADMLGVEVPYLEKTVGPAKRVSRMGGGKTLRTYVVDGCPVQAHVDGTSVYAYGMDMTPSCNVNLRPFFDDLASTKNLTVGKFARIVGDGSFHATCLTNCGPSDDPVASYHWQGPRPARLEVELLFPLQQQPSDDAPVRLAKAMTDKDGPAYASSGSFNCDAKYNAAALDVYKEAPVTQIVIGSGIEDETGAYGASCQKTN